MFTTEFIDERRKLFAEQLEVGVYSYTIDGIQYMSRTYFVSRTITGNTILLTLRMPNIQGVPHTIDTVYLLRPGQNPDDVTLDNVDGYKIGEITVDTTINAYQSYVVRLRVSYRETEEGYVASDAEAEIEPE